jgi:hypothetical protein
MNVGNIVIPSEEKKIYHQEVRKSRRQAHEQVSSVQPVLVLYDISRVLRIALQYLDQIFSQDAVTV